MLEHLIDPQADLVPLTAVRRSGWKDWLEGQTEALRAWVRNSGFVPDNGAVCLVPGENGALARVLVGIDPADPWSLAGLPQKLPRGGYRLEAALEPKAASWAAMAWALGTYGFTRYKGQGRDWPRLAWPEGGDRDWVEAVVQATALVRDLVNTPANDMGPEELAEAADHLARRFAARIRVISGEMLLFENYPAIHAVGRASVRQPRLIDLRWGDEDAPRVTIVGKGVCFDSGGLDLKSASNMKLMKKDMGGAAHALGLALAVMRLGLKIRLRVLIPAVENSVAGNAFRPMDVLTTRKGLTVEVGNTDAEGRLVLCDALAEAGRENPDLLIDLATLTGAARTALGPELPALFTNQDGLAADLARHAEAECDPLWRLPLWKNYRRMLDSKVADLNNASDSPFAGAITAALFLQEFVEPKTAWAHLDLYAWNSAPRPGRPEGGEAFALRALLALLTERYPA